MSGLWSAAAALVCALALLAGTAGTALAIDPPRWVAVIYVDAQRSVGLRWLPAPGATGYKVFRSQTKGSGYAEIGAPTQPQHFDNAVQPGETYYYVLQAVAGAEVSANGEERSVTIPGQKKIATLPPEWAAVKADASTEFGKTNYRVGLSWNTPKAGKAIAYNLYRSETSGKDYQSISSSPDTSFIDTKVEVGKTYYYVLTTLDDSFMESPFSAEQKVTIAEIKKEASKKKKKLVGVSLYTKKVFMLDNSLGLLQQPRDLAVDDDGTVFVVDGSGKKIVVFNKDNEFVARLGVPGKDEGKLDSPSGIVIFDDRLYVTDTTAQFVHIFEKDGKPVKSVKVYQDPKLPGPMKPWGIAHDKVKGRFYVVDNWNHQVHAYDEDLKFLFKFGTKYDDAGKPIEPKELGWPIGVAVSNDGSRVVVADGEAHITFYDDSGNMVAQVGERGAGVGTFMYPNGLIHDPAHDWFFAMDKTVNNAQIFDGNGNFKYILMDEKGEKSPGMSNPNNGKIVGNRLYITENIVKQYSVWEILWDKSPPPYKAEE